MHSPKTLRPESDSPSWGRYPELVPRVTLRLPYSSVSSPARVLSSVVLPVPLAPTSPARSFEVISQFRFSKSSLWPKRLPAPESWIIAETFLVSSFSFLVPNVEDRPVADAQGYLVDACGYRTVPLLTRGAT